MDPDSGVLLTPHAIPSYRGCSSIERKELSLYHLKFYLD